MTFLLAMLIVLVGACSIVAWYRLRETPDQRAWRLAFLARLKEMT